MFPKFNTTHLEASKIWITVKDYLDNSSIHGLKYITQTGRHWLERMFWLVACSISFYGCYRVGVATLEAFREHAVSFVPETTYLHWNTGFPAVTICEKKNSTKMWSLAERAYPNETLKIRKVSMYLGEMIYYKGKCANCKEHCSNSIQCPENILELANEVLPNCTSLLDSCYWNDVEFECCDNFSPQLTAYGFCYIMNSLQIKTDNEKNRKTINLISNKFTGPGRLQFRIFVDSEMYFSSQEDVLYLGKEADPDLSSYGLGRSYTIHFRVTEIENDPQLSHLTISQRGCILPQENPLNMYKLFSLSACLTECQAKAQLQLCGCVHHYIPKGVGRTCNLDGIMCIQKYAGSLNEIQTTGLPELNVTCDCVFPSCFEPEYKLIYTDVAELETGDMSSFQLQMISLPTVRYKRNVVRSKLDLVVSTGGAAGLFLGASILSTVEVVMYFCFRTISKQKQLNRN